MTEERRLDVQRRCPDDVWGEAHADGPPISTTLWSIRQAIGQAAADKLAWNVLVGVSATPTYAEIAQIIQDSATGLEAAGELDAASMDAVGVILADSGLPTCADAAVIAADEPRQGGLIGAVDLKDVTGLDRCAVVRAGNLREPLPIPFKFTMPDDPNIIGASIAIAMKRVDGTDLADDDLMCEAYLRVNARVEFELTPIEFGELFLEVPGGMSAFDVGVEDTPAEISATFEELGAVAGDVVHFNLATANCPRVRTTFTLTWLTAPEPEPEPEPQANVAEVVAESDSGNDTSDAAVADVGSSTPDSANNPGNVDEGCSGAPGGRGELVFLWLLVGMATLHRRRERPAVTQGSCPCSCAVSA